MVAFQNVLAFIGGATIPICAIIFRKFNPPHTAYQECLDHLKDLDQRAKETWQRSEIPDGTWIKSKTRLTHSALCNMHHGLESMPWEVESHNWHIMMDSEASVIVRDYYAGNPQEKHGSSK
ncbi:uncharacterized protein EAF02_011089 [Botrytis sinoallii]|uniref:uncharacterized protein n=1 Tax=Botrytis sinoallii TaxID=1463999 RepID=UPI00190248D6|nr:uncharacterized protein EAF02_011089 [Botrytis sinoallii]KAF7858765.1 hypothetical protein EAF02_011089 [Botrytis sinoallii]